MIIIKNPTRLIQSLKKKSGRLHPDSGELIIRTSTNLIEISAIEKDSSSIWQYEALDMDCAGEIVIDFKKLDLQNLLNFLGIVSKSSKINEIKIVPDDVGLGVNFEVGESKFSVPWKGTKVFPGVFSGEQVVASFSKETWQKSRTIAKQINVANEFVSFRQVKIDNKVAMFIDEPCALLVRGEPTKTPVTIPMDVLFGLDAKAEVDLIYDDQADIYSFRSVFKNDYSLITVNALGETSGIIKNSKFPSVKIINLRKKLVKLEPVLKLGREDVDLICDMLKGGNCRLVVNGPNCDLKSTISENSEAAIRLNVTGEKLLTDKIKINLDKTLGVYFGIMKEHMGEELILAKDKGMLYCVGKDIEAIMVSNV